MARRGVVLIAMLAASDAAAQAGDLDDCRQFRRPEIRIEACGKVIAGGDYSAKEKALAFRMRGAARADAGAVADAIADYTQSLNIEPDSVPSLQGRGLARLTAGDLAGARADYDAAVKLAPNAAGLLMTRGHIRLTSGDVDGAIADLTQAITLDPKSAVALNNRGLAWRRKGDLAKAEEDYTAALALNPIYAVAYANRGYTREAMAKRNEAVADLRQAVLLDPSLSEARDALKRLGSNEWTVEGDRRLAQGKALVEANCSRCHAVGTAGASPNPKAPEFRGLARRHPQLALREPLTRGILAQHDEMPRFQLSNTEIDAIVAYISGLQGGR